MFDLVSDVFQFAMISCVVIYTTIASVSDSRHKKLPNWLTVPAFAAALVFHAIGGYLGVEITSAKPLFAANSSVSETATVEAAVEPVVHVSGWRGSLRQVGFSLLGFAGGFGILFVLWCIAGGGGGDVKFMAALGAWLGLWNIVAVFLLSTVLIIVMSIGRLIYEGCRVGVGRTRSRFLSPAKTAGHGSEKVRLEADEAQRKRRRLVGYAVPSTLATWGVIAFHLFT
jgi:prepilin peptidase CpaA